VKSAVSKFDFSLCIIKMSQVVKDYLSFNEILRVLKKKYYFDQKLVIM